MKKFLAIFLALVLMFSFAACGTDTGSADDKDDAAVEDKDEVKDDEAKDDEAEDNEEDEADEPEDSEKDEPKDTEEDADAEESGAIKLGKVADGKYTNEFTGWSIALDENWTFATEDELKTINSVDASLEGDELVAALEDVMFFYDMNATHSNGAETIGLLFNKMGDNLTQAELEENLELTFETTESTFATLGYENIAHEIEIVDVNGKSLTALTITADIAEYQMVQVTFAEVIGEYVITCTVTALSEDTLTSFIEGFTFTK